MKKRAFLFVILAGLLWGSSVIFVNVLAPFGFSSLQMTFVRSVVSFVCLFIYAVIKDRSIFKVTFKELIINTLVGITFFGTATCYFFAMQATSPSTAVVLMYLAPVIVLIYSVLFLGEKLTFLKGTSVFAMLIGCGLVSGIIGGLAFKPLGLAIGFLSGLSYALYNIFTKIGTKNKINPITITLYCFLVASVVSFFSCNPSQIPVFMAGNVLKTSVLLIMMGICTCVLPYFFYTMGMKDLPAGTASALGIVEPMAATVLSVVFFKEELSIFKFIGIILILGATFALSKSDSNLEIGDKLNV